MKTYYIIQYVGICTYGTVTIGLFEKEGPTNKPPTRFRTRILANVVCWLLNKGDKKFNTYSVTPVIPYK